MSKRLTTNSWRTRLGALLLGLLLVIAGGEIAARLLWEAPAPAPSRESGDPDLPILEKLPDLARPNARGLHRGVLFRTDSLGLRGPEYARSAGPGVFRIVVVGDSITMAWGVEEQDSYSQQLRERLEASLPGRRFEVVNAGLAGINATGAIDRLAFTLAHLEADLLVYGYTINDIEGPRYAARAAPGNSAFLRSLRWADSPSYLLRSIMPRWITISSSLWPTDDSPLGELHYNYFENPAAWGDVTTALDRLAMLAAERDVCAVVFLHTPIAQLGLLHPYRPFYAVIERAAAERGLATAASYPGFAGQRAQDLWVGPMDPHPNREGHAILAARLEQALLGLPPRCGLAATNPR